MAKSSNSFKPYWEIYDGSGPHLLLVHGFLSSRGQWMHNIEALSRFATPVIVELLGHGRSPSPEPSELYHPEAYVAAFEDIRQQLGVASWIICGQSLGASLTLRYALRHPECIKAQIFTNTVAGLAEDMSAKLDMNKAKVIRVRGNLSDNTVKNRLEKAGAEVHELTVYETYYPEWPDGIKEKLFEHPPDVIVFTSGSTATGLAKILSTDEFKQLTASAKIVSIGPMTTSVIESYGPEVTLEVTTHSIPGVIEAILAYFEKNPFKR